MDARSAQAVRDLELVVFGFVVFAAGIGTLIYLRKSGTGIGIVGDFLKVLWEMITEPFASLFTRFRRKQEVTDQTDWFPDAEQIREWEEGAVRRLTLPTTERADSDHVVRTLVQTVSEQFVPTQPIKHIQKQTDERDHEFKREELESDQERLTAFLNFWQFVPLAEQLWEDAEYEPTIALITQSVTNLTNQLSDDSRFSQMLNTVASLCREFAGKAGDSRPDLVSVLTEMASNYEAGIVVPIDKQKQIADELAKALHDGDGEDLERRVDEILEYALAGPAKTNETEWIDSELGAEATDLEPTPGEQEGSECAVEKSQETEWSDAPQSGAQETAFAKTRVALTALEAAVQEEWKVGDVILDLYEVTGVLGEGGFGKVYRVHHKGWNLDLAVKTPRIDRLDEPGKESFRSEAETWVNLGLHPHTVSCYYVRDLGGIPRVFAEYVDGGSLSDWIRTRKLYEGSKAEALMRILDIAIQFAWGLHYAHEQGLVHQDVKPANVMMTPEGVAKVTDFGLAKARRIADESGLINDTSLLVKGGGMTPAYASPEQASGKPLSRATDIWSWAVSVLEMFIGEVTWISGSAAAEALEECLAAPIADGKIPDIPNSVSELLKQCFQHDSKFRPRNCLDLVSSLEDLYFHIHGRSYPRIKPEAAKAVAASLNNRAVSLMDLGKTTEALALWTQALDVQQHHPEATYNRGLILWRSGEINDDTLVSEIEESIRSNPDKGMVQYLLGQVHLERDDVDGAITAFENALALSDLNVKSVESALSLAVKRQANVVQICNTLKGHTRAIESMSFAFDGQFLLSGSYDQTVRMWSVYEAQLVRTFEGHADCVRSVSFSPDGRFVLSGSDDSQIKLWEVGTGQCLQTFEGKFGSIYSVCFSPQGKVALSGSSNDSLQLWEIETGQCSRIFDGHDSTVCSVCFSPDGAHALSGSGDCTLKLWRIATGECVRTLEGHRYGVSSISFSPDGTHALSGSHDHTLKLWEIETGQCLATFHGGANSVSCIGFSPDGKLGLSGSEVENKVRLWDFTAGRCLRTFEGHTDDVIAVSFSPDGNAILSGSADGTLRVRNMLRTDYFAGLSICQIVDSSTAIHNEISAQTNLALAEKAFLLSNYIETAAYLREVRRVRGYERYPKALELWTKLYTRVVRVGRVSGWLHHTFKGHTNEIGSVHFSPNGKLALSGSYDYTMKLWDVDGCQCVRTFDGHSDIVESVSFSSDGNVIASGSSDGVKIWDIETGHCVRTINCDYRIVFSMSLSPDGKSVLSGTNDPVPKLWDVETGKCLRTFEGHSGNVVAVSFSPDGNLVASGSSDGRVKVWGVETSQCLQTFDGHSREVRCLSFSPDGRFVASGGSDSTIRIWDLKTSQCLRTFDWNTSAISLAQMENSCSQEARTIR